MQQFVLDLRFLDWVRALPEDRGHFLFPEALERSELGKATDAVGKHPKNLSSRLGRADVEEGFYARA